MNARAVAHVVPHQIQFKTQIVRRTVLHLDIDIHVQGIALVPERLFHGHVTHAAQPLKTLNGRRQCVAFVEVSRTPIHNVPPHLWPEAPNCVLGSRTA